MERRKELPKLTDRLQLGQLETKVSPFCLGLVRSPQTISAAFDAGINFFFVTADMHWPLYEQTRLGLKMLIDQKKSIRDEIVVGVVSYVAQPEFTIFPFIEVLEAIPGVKKIDVAIIGGAYGGEFMSRLQSYERNRRDGSVPFDCIGATFHDRSTAVPAVNHNMVDIAFIRYNALHPAAIEEVFPHVSETRKTLLYNFNNTVGYVSHERYSTLKIGKDYWRPDITDCYRFALSAPQMDGLLCALKTPDQLYELEGALMKGPLDQSEQNYMINLAMLNTGQITLGDQEKEE